jgi:Spy/CpxP family protein refolding chaperone
MKLRLLLASALLVATPYGFSQAAPPSAPPPPGANGPAPIVRNHEKSDDKGGREMPGREMRGLGGGMLPPGTWWRDAAVAGRIGLSAEQQKRIDEIFLQSRVQLIHMHASLEEEELMLEPLLNANPVDQGKALAQIGKIADTRADLEKADAKMLLGIRAVLTADQWTKLQAERHAMRRGIEGRRGPGGEGAPGGMRGPMGHGPGGMPGPPPPQ